MADADTALTAGQYVILAQAGLDCEKIIFHSKDRDHDFLLGTLIKAYPMLDTQKGVFELPRAEKGGQSPLLVLVPPLASGYLISYPRKVVNTNTNFCKTWPPSRVIYP